MLKGNMSFGMGSGFLILVLSGTLLTFGLDGPKEYLRVNILEWRLPAEVEYLRIGNEFLKRQQAIETQYKDQPKLLKYNKEQIRKEEKELLKHTMDLHGFDESEFWDFQSKEGDRKLKERIMEKDPEEFRRGNIYRLQSLIASGKRTIKLLEAKGAETVEVVRQEFEQYELELASLQQQEAQWQFPRPQDGETAFSLLTLDWWETKRQFMEQYRDLSVSEKTYPRNRWNLVQTYRDDLRDLMRSHRIQSTHYDEYQKQSPHFLQDYLQKHHDEQQARLETLQASVNKYDASVTIEQAQGMGMIVGTVIHCAVPPARCRGEAKDNGKPLGGIPIELVTEGDNSRKPEQFFFRTNSNKQGQFIIPAVPPGDYYLNAQHIEKDRGFMYRGSGRKFFVEGNHEVLILDLLVEKVAVTIRPVSPTGTAP